MIDMTIFVTERNIVILFHKHVLLLAMEELFMLKIKIMSLGLKGLFPMVHLSGNLFTKIVPALKESQYSI